MTPILPHDGGVPGPGPDEDARYIRDASRALDLDALLGLTAAERSRGDSALEAILAAGAPVAAADDAETVGGSAGAPSRRERILAALREADSADGARGPLSVVRGPLSVARTAPAGNPPPARRRRRRRLLATSLALAAALALVFGVVVAQPFGGAPAVAATPPVLNFEFVKAQEIATSGGAPAREALLGLASAAGRQPEPARDGEVQRVVSDNWFSTTKVERDGRGRTVVVPRVVEKYVTPDGAVRTLESAAAPLSADGRTRVDDAARAQGPRKSDTLLAPDRSVLEDAPERLPAEPRDLRRELLARSGCAAGTASGSAAPPNGDPSDRAASAPNPEASPAGGTAANPAQQAEALCLYTGATDLYQTWVVPPRIESSLWTVLADQPGIGYLGSVRDRLGRDGVGFSAFDAENSTRRVFIVNPRTGRLLGTEEILTKPLPKAGIKAPAVLSFTALVNSAWVQSPPPVTPQTHRD